MAFTTLINSETLTAHLADPAFAIVDCRFSLDDEQWGEREYVARHIPSAVYAHLDGDLSGIKTDRNGRHPLPDAAVLRHTLGRLGISSDIQVVAYDQDAGMYASRLWWLLRWLGHDAVAVLDGGFARWLAQGRPTSAGRETRTARTFIGSPLSGLFVGPDEVATLLGRRDWRLVDARAGTIPGRHRTDRQRRRTHPRRRESFLQMEP